MAWLLKTPNSSELHKSPLGSDLARITLLLTENITYPEIQHRYFKREMFETVKSSLKKTKKTRNFRTSQSLVQKKTKRRFFSLRHFLIRQQCSKCRAICHHLMQQNPVGYPKWWALEKVTPWQFLVTFLGWLSDLQHVDEKVTLRWQFWVREISGRNLNQKKSGKFEREKTATLFSEENTWMFLFLGDSKHKSGLSKKPSSRSKIHGVTIHGFLLTRVAK